MKEAPRVLAVRVFAFHPQRCDAAASAVHVFAQDTRLGSMETNRGLSRALIHTLAAKVLPPFPHLIIMITRIMTMMPTIKKITNDDNIIFPISSSIIIYSSLPVTSYTAFIVDALLFYLRYLRRTTVVFIYIIITITVIILTTIIPISCRLISSDLSSPAC